MVHRIFEEARFLMKALVKTAKGPGNVQLIENHPKPQVKPGWVLVEVFACGICGTDLHILEDTHKNWPPVVLGHEYTGAIVEVGPDCGDWKIGDRVVCEQHHGACLRCDACRRGAIHLCSSKRSPGWGIDGAFAEYVLLPAWLLHKVPENVPYKKATVTEPTAICISGLDQVNLKSGEKVLVVGPGPIGLISAMLAKVSGASRVVIAGRESSKARLDLSEKLGFETYVIGDWSQAQQDLGEKFDVAIDSSGAGDALSLCVGSVRKLGRVLELGLSSTPTVTFSLNLATTKSVAIFTSLSSEYSTWDRALALMASGKYDPSVLTEVYMLDDWQKAFDDVEHRKVVKGVITPKGKQFLD